MSLLDDQNQAFEEPKRAKGPGVSDDQALEQMRQNAEIQIPILAPQPARAGSCIFVAGGPSLRDHLEEIRARKANGEYILTSNNTHDYLVDHGIIPNACLLLDPKEQVKNYVDKHQTDTAYFVSSCAHPLVVQKVLERGCKAIR